jgi:hypothetical protein
VSTLCLLSLLLATAAPGTEKTVWLLEQTDWQREEAALLEALLMYTRDLRVPITISMTPNEPDAAAGDTPATETPEDQVQTAQARCASGALLVLWFGGDRTAPSLSMVHCGQSTVTKMRLVPVDDLDLAAQTLALKLRGVIAQIPHEPSRPSTKSKPPADSSGLADKPAAVVAPNPWELGLGYSLLAASADSGLRQGATLRLGSSLGRWPIAIEADATFATSMALGASGYRGSASDLPMGVGLSVRWDMSPWLLAAGPRASLHYVKANASSPDGREGQDSSFALGVGALGQMRYQAWKTLAFAMALSSEVVMPRQRFTLDRSYPLDVGMWQWALTVGVVYSHY